MKRHPSSERLVLLLGTAIVLTLTIVMLLAVLPVSAEVPAAEVSPDSLRLLIPSSDDGNPPVNDGCIQDAYIAGGGQGGSLNCTADDVKIADVTDVVVIDDGCAFPGDTVTFTADYEVVTTADARYDVGLYFSTDGDPEGDGALTGQCTVATLPYAPDPPWLDLDGVVNGTQDTCGDINTAHNPLAPQITITAQCIDTDGDGFLNVYTCTSWRQSGVNDLCTTPTDAFPGSPAKCRCDTGLQIPIEIPGQIIVDKVTVPADASDSFPFDLTGDATASFSLTDAADPWESSNLSEGTYQVTENVPNGWALSASCTSDNATPDDPTDDSMFDYTNGADLPLASGEIITCTFTNTAQSNIIVKKVTTRPGASTLFPFDPSWSDENFSLLDGGQQDSGPLAPGEYTVTELVPNYWKLVDLVCVDPDDGTTVDRASATATVDLDAGETVTCTFTNEKYGRIVITKAVSPNSKSWDPNTQFEFDPSWQDGNFFLQNGGRFDTSYTVWPGDYTVSEINLPPGWSLLQVSCNDPTGDSTASLATGTANINLATGETVTCKFLNIKK